ncbi:MAG TPA: 30S ribosomal protein S14, partial [Caldisericia bacterium]|nr:30S ribosomal protein S14 [Caldisericia bacterium]
MAKTALINKSNRKPKFSTRAYNRCKICRRPHAYYRDFGLCRLCLR